MYKNKTGSVSLTMYKNQLKMEKRPKFKALDNKVAGIKYKRTLQDIEVQGDFWTRSPKNR